MSDPKDQEQSGKEAKLRAELTTRDECNAADALRRERIASARKILLTRDLRTSTFGSDMAEPAWEMLLSLYIGEHSREHLTAANLAMLTDVPPSTAIRWLGYLRSHGYVADAVAGEAQSRGPVRLLPKALDLLERYFTALVSKL